MTAVCQSVSPLWVIVPPLLWLLWYGPRSDRRYLAVLERIAAQPRSSRTRPRSGARKPKGRGR